jgi:hypothetical protein
MRGATLARLGLALLGLGACGDNGSGWQGPACAKLGPIDAPRGVIALTAVERTANTTLVLWQGWTAPDDPVMLSVRDDPTGWRRPLRLREHVDTPPSTALTAHGALFFSQDYATRKPLFPDAGVGLGDSFESRLTLMDDTCNSIEFGAFRAANYPLTALTNDGLAAVAWSGDGTVEAVVARRAQTPEHSTLRKSGALRPALVNFAALSDGSLIAVMIERGPTEGDPKRLLSARFDGRWQAPVLQDADDSGGELVDAVVASGPNGSAALLWIAKTPGTQELRMRRASVGEQWGTQFKLHASEDFIEQPQLVLGHDGRRAAVLWRVNGTWWARLVDGDEPLGEAVSAECDCTGDASAVIDSAGRLLVAWEEEGSQGRLAWFDGTRWSASQMIGSTDGDVTRPRLAAGPDGRAVAVWEQHKGPALNLDGDMQLPTPSKLMSADVVDGKVRGAQPLVH